MSNQQQRKHILITGGTGLLGSALKATAPAHVTFLCINSSICDLRDFEYSKTRIQQLHQSQAFDAVIHCAARVGGLFRNLHEPVEMLNDNLQINTNILRIAHELNIDQVVCVMSTCIFPNDIEYPLQPEQLHNGAPHHSNACYAHAKRLLDVACRAYQQQHNRHYYCVVPTNMYGPHDNYHDFNSHVIPALIKKAITSKDQGKDFEIKGSGEHLRQFIYSEDAAKIIWWSLDYWTHHQIPLMLVAPNSEIGIKDIVYKIQEIVSRKYNISNTIVFNDSIDGGQYKKTALDTEEQIQRLLNNQDQSSSTFHINWTTFEDGLEQAIEWFYSSYNNRE
jgi:GDP-L-fucose synthase